MYCAPVIIFIVMCERISVLQGKALAAPPDASLVDTSPVLGTTIDENSAPPANPCTVRPLGIDDVEFLGGDYMFLKAYNETIHITSSKLKVEGVHICFNRSEKLEAEVFRLCQKWSYKEDEYEKLANGSVLLYDEILEPGTFEFEGGNLLTCAGEEEDDVTYERHRTREEMASIYIGKIGSSISIIALTAHLITFCLVPSLRNLPGYNLASLSVAFLFGYSFVLIGQIPEVLGLACVVSGVLQQNFFLVAFFCMNVMAIDIWRTLRLATQKLVVNSHDIKKRQFVFYTIYSWGVPLIITITSVLMDNVEGVPEWIRPEFGLNDTCWMNNNDAKAIFFSIPAFSLFVLNGIFFVMSANIIKNNTMRSTNDQHKQTVRLNFVLYVRLGLMMGVTWLLGVLAAALRSPVIWMISDTFNSLQGLFLFLLFTCSRKVFNRIRETVNSRTSKVTSTATEKHTTSGTKTDSTPTEQSDRTMGMKRCQQNNRTWYNYPNIAISPTPSPKDTST